MVNSSVKNPSKMAGNVSEVYIFLNTKVNIKTVSLTWRNPQFVRKKYCVKKSLQWSVEGDMMDKLHQLHRWPKDSTDYFYLKEGKIR